MGQSKGGGYDKQSLITPEIKTFLEKLIGSSGGNMDAAAEGYKEFLPGGGGGKAISDAANQRFKQETIPSIMNAYGSGAKTSSALNQALAAGAANLNTDIASKLSEMQLQAAQGLSNQGVQQANIGTQTPQFAYTQRQQPFWQSAILAGINGGSQIAKGAIGGGV